VGLAEHAGDLVDRFLVALHLEPALGAAATIGPYFAVQSKPGEGLHLAPLDHQLGAVAVIFDFMNPVVALRRLLHQRRQLNSMKRSRSPPVAAGRLLKPSPITHKRVTTCHNPRGSGTFLLAVAYMGADKSIQSMKTTTSTEVREERARRRDEEAAAIIAAERAAREAKTRRLRELRLAKQRKDEQTKH
jgi:hypothetical protein